MIEDYFDRRVIQKTDFKKGKDFEKVAKELGITKLSTKKFLSVN